MTPRRIQRRRTKGYRMPEGAVYVGRPTKWGNPFKVEGAIEAGFAMCESEARKVCVDTFRDWLRGQWFWPHGEPQREALLASLDELAGKDLVCWCAPAAPCHADVLLEAANA